MGLHRTSKPGILGYFHSAAYPCAFAHLPSDFRADRIVIDGAQYAIVVRLPGLCPTGEAYFRRMSWAVGRHWNYVPDLLPKPKEEEEEEEKREEEEEEDEGPGDRPPASSPRKAKWRNKAEAKRTAVKREDDPQFRQAYETRDRYPDEIVLCIDSPGLPPIKGVEQRRRDRDAGVLTKQNYLQHVLKRIRTNHYYSPIIINDGPLPANDARVWRSPITRYQLTYYLGARFAMDFPVPSGRLAVLDEAIPHSPEALHALREQVAADCGLTLPDLPLGELPPGLAADVTLEDLADLFEIETMVARSLDRFVAYMSIDSEHRVGHQAPYTRGEFDTKVCTHIPRDSTKTFLVVSQDSDLVLILLLHLERLGGAAYAGQIWLDTRVPRKLKTEPEHRFLHINALHASIHAYFADNMPHVDCPIETLAYLALLMKNDFTEAMPHVTNFKLVFDMFERSFGQPGVAPLLQVVEGPDPQSDRMYADCSRRCGLDVNRAYNFYLRLQEEVLSATARALEMRHVPEPGYYKLGNSGRTADAVLIGMLISSGLDDIVKLRAEERASKELWFDSDGTDVGKLAPTIESEETYEKRLLRQQVKRPRLYYLGRYSDQKAETLIGKWVTQREKPGSDLYWVLNRKPGHRFLRAVLWVLNYMANPEANEFARIGWALADHWGWREDAVAAADAKEFGAAECSVLYTLRMSPGGYAERHYMVPVLSDEVVL